MVESRRFLPIKDTVRAKESDKAQAKDGGGERHLMAGAQSGFVYSSYIKFDHDWSGVEKIVRADLVFTTEEDAHIGWPNDRSGVKVWRLAGNFPDVNDGDPEGTFGGSWPVEGKDPDHATAGTVDDGDGTISRIVITALVADMAPKSVRRPNGNPGGDKDNHGFAIERRTTDVQPNPRMCVGSMKNADTSKRPYIELFYEAKKSPNTVTTVAPTGTIFDIAGESFEGTFELGANQPADAALARIGIELYIEGGSDPVWSYDAAASPSDVQDSTCTVPLSLVATTGSRYRFVSAQGYEWRLRAKDNHGDWTAWSGKRDFLVSTNPPVLSNLRPTATPTLDTLNNVYFRAGYSDPDGNPLLKFEVQVRDQTLPTDPAWADDLIWASGPIDGSGFVPRVVGQPTEIAQPYGGTGLLPGTYSWRMRAWDILSASSAWVYSEFVLTKGWEPEPGEVDLLTGYANRRLKARVLIKGMKNQVQTLRMVGDPDSGHWKLTYAGEQTAGIVFDATAGEVKSALTALPNLASDEVTVEKDGKHKWIVRFQARYADRPLLVAGGYTGFAGGERVDVYSDRAPGVPIAVIEDAANVGASEMYNSGGEFFFSLPAIHPQAHVIQPYRVHYALEVYRGESWREIAAGYITDFDATSDDVVFYGQDYMAILGRQIDERFNPAGSADAEAKLWPDTGGGAKYVNRTIKQIIQDQLDRSIDEVGSPLAFFSRSSIPDFSDIVSIFVSFKERLPFIAGLIESWRAGKGIRTRIHAKRVGDGKYQWSVKGNPGRDRPNLRMEFGGLVQGFRVIPYGDFATRLNALGKLYNSSRLEYKIVKPPTPAGKDGGWYEETYGRFARASTYDDITDPNDLQRRAQQEAMRMTRIGKALALNLRPGSFSIKDGWDICDSVPVDIKRGVVDTSAMGSGYWTIWGWTWELKPTGQEIITLSILPKEDDIFDDVVPDPPRPPDDGTGGGHGHGPPGDDTPGDHYCDDDTGQCFHKCEDGTKWCPDEGDDVGPELAFLCIEYGSQSTTDRPIIMLVCDGADVPGRDLIIQLSIDDPTTIGPELAIPIDARFMGEVADYHAWTWTNIYPSVSFMLYEGVGPTNCGVGCGGCTAPATRWSGWTHREGWFSMTLPATYPAGVKALRVDLADLFGSPIGVGTTEAWGIRYSIDPPTGEGAGVELGQFTYPASPYFDIPLDQLPTGGGPIYLGVTPAWSAARGSTVCSLQEPAQNGLGDSGRGQYQPITVSSKWVFGAPSAAESWIATMEAALPGVVLIEEASGEANGIIHLTFRYRIHSGDFPAVDAGLALYPPEGTFVPPEPPEFPPVPPTDIPFPVEPVEPDPVDPPAWWDGLQPIPDDLIVRWTTALYEGVTDVAGNSLAAGTAAPNPPEFDPPWIDAPPAIWASGLSSIPTLPTPPGDYTQLAPVVDGLGASGYSHRDAPGLGIQNDSVTYDPGAYGGSETSSFVTNVVLAHLPSTGMDFEDVFIAYADGIQTTFQGFPTVPGTAKWYVDGILVKPLSYDPATGIVVFDRPPAYNAYITQWGTKAPAPEPEP